MTKDWKLSDLHAIRLPTKPKISISAMKRSQPYYSVDIQIVSGTKSDILANEFPLYMIGDQKQQDQLRSFSAEPSKAKLKLSLYVPRTIRSTRKQIGEAEEVLEVVLSGCDQDGVATLNIFNTEGEVIGELRFKLVLVHSDIECMEDAVSQALSAKTSSPLPQAFLDGINQANQVAQGASAFGDTLKSICTNLKFLQNLGDKLSEIHPYAKFAWTVLTCIVKAVQKQIELDQNVQSLAEAMKDTFDLVMRYEEKYLITKSTVILRMVQQTTECGSFICHYWGTKQFGKRALESMLSSPKDKVDKFKNKFSELRDVFTAERVSNVDLVVCRIEDILKELRMELKDHIIETRLNCVPCAKGARFSATNICLPNTRAAIQDMIYQWIATGGRLEEDGPETSIFLLHGMAGTGKSTIANTVSSVLNGTERGISYRFSRDFWNDRNAENFFSTIALGMAGLEEAYRLKLAEVLKDQSLRSSTDPNEQYKKFILEPMCSLTGIGVITVVVDAVDECASRQTILHILSKGSFPENLRFILTTRAENDIMNALQDKPHVLVQEINELSVESIYSDIKTYIHHRLSKTQITDLDLERLASNAEGHFQWAATACDYISPDGRAGVCSRTRLETVLSPGSSLNRLDDLYSAILTERFPDKDSEVHTVKRVLATLLAAAEPLSLAMLNVVCAKEAVKTVIPYLGPLLSVNAEQVRPVHTSFRDYLTDISRSKHFHVDLLEGHRALAVFSFRTMKTQLRFNICDIKTSYRLNSELSLDLDKISPELFYSCRFWSDHLAQIDIDDLTQEDVSHFMKNQILFWLEVLSLRQCVNFAKPALQRLIRRPATWKDSDISPLAEATIELIEYFPLPIRTSVPHIYISALALSPPSSYLWRHYSIQYNLLQWSGHIRSHHIQAVLHTGGSVSSIAISSDDKKIISAGDGIRLWDAETMQAIGENPWQGTLGHINSVSFSPDDKRVVCATYEGIHVWDVEKMEVVGDGIDNRVLAIAFSSDGKRFVSGSYGRTIRIWDAEKMEVVGELLNGHTKSITSVAFSHNGKRIVSGSLDNTIRVWDAENIEAEGEPLNGHTRKVTSVAFSHDDRRIVSGGYDGIHIWDVEKMKSVGRINNRWIESVIFSPDSTWIVSASLYDINVYDAETFTAVGKPLRAHIADVTSVAFSHDGKKIFSGSHDQTIRVWDAEKIEKTGQQVPEYHNVDNRDQRHTSVAFSPDGNWIISGASDGTIHVWDAKKMEASRGPLSSSCFWHYDMVTSINFSPDGNRMVSASMCGRVCIWDTKRMELAEPPLDVNLIYRPIDILNAMPLPDGESLNFFYPKIISSSVVFSPDGKRIISRFEWERRTAEICMWDAETNEKIKLSLSSDPWYGHFKTVVASLPDGRARVCRHLGLTSLQGNTDEQSNPGSRYNCKLNAAAFSPDDKMIVFASSDGMIHVWHVEKEVAGQPLMGHGSNSVISVRFSPDGNRIVSGSKDGTIRVWDAEQLNATFILPSPRSESQFGALFKRVARSTYLHHDPFCKVQKDGWVTGPNSERFLWVPAYLRNQFPFPYLLSILSGEPILQIDDTNFYHGESWTKCHKNET